MSTPTKARQTSRIKRVRAAPPEDDAPWLTSVDIAAQLRVSRRLVLDWIHSGELPAVNLSANPETPSRTGWRISREALDTFLASRGGGFVSVDGPAQRHAADEAAL